jgi:hypothetical protein
VGSANGSKNNFNNVNGKVRCTLKELLFYLGNVLLIAVPLAIFEVWLENFKPGPWGHTEFDHPFWGKKLKWFGNCWPFEKAYVTPYHLIMFGVIVPSITVIEYAALRYLAISGWIVLSFKYMTIVAPLFIAAIWIGNMVLEDFLYMVFISFGNRFPYALDKFLHGEFEWHKKWFPEKSKIKLPRSYFIGLIAIEFLFLLQQIIIRLVHS